MEVKHMRKKAALICFLILIISMILQGCNKSELLPSGDTEMLKIALSSTDCVTLFNGDSGKGIIIDDKEKVDEICDIFSSDIFIYWYDISEETDGFHWSFNFYDANGNKLCSGITVSPNYIREGSTQIDGYSVIFDSKAYYVKECEFFDTLDAMLELNGLPSDEYVKQTEHLSK
jgi:hypothetical protein